jgi:hypothetical protein
MFSSFVFSKALVRKEVPAQYPGAEWNTKALPRNDGEERKQGDFFPVL